MEPHDERRGARRYELDLVVTLDGVPGESRNLSSTGLYVLSQGAFPPGTEVSVEVFFPGLSGRRKRLLGRGRVLREESNGSGAGVALQLLGWAFV